MNRRLTFILLACLCCGSVLLAVGAITQTHVVWDGGFSRAEYQLVLTDSLRRPLSGVRLRVTDKSGNDSFCFPITDYQKDKQLSSNRDGVITFHHAGVGTEFSGHYTEYLYWIRIGTTDAPDYFCRFEKNDAEIARLNYKVLNALDSVLLDRNGEPSKVEWERPLEPEFRHLASHLRMSLLELPERVSLPVIRTRLVINEGRASFERVAE
jgi:hypothetical protein